MSMDLEAFLTKAPAHMHYVLRLYARREIEYLVHDLRGRGLEAESVWHLRVGLSLFLDDASSLTM